MDKTEMHQKALDHLAIALSEVHVAFTYLNHAEIGMYWGNPESCTGEIRIAMEKVVKGLKSETP